MNMQYAVQWRWALRSKAKQCKEAGGWPSDRWPGKASDTDFI